MCEVDPPFCAPIFQLPHHNAAHHTIHHIIAWARPILIVNTINGGIPSVIPPPQTTRQDALSFAMSWLYPSDVDTCTKPSFWPALKKKQNNSQLAGTRGDSCVSSSFSSSLLSSHPFPSSTHNRRRVACKERCCAQVCVEDCHKKECVTIMALIRAPQRGTR